MTRILAANTEIIPDIPIGEWFATFFDWLNENLGPLWAFIERVFNVVFEEISEFLQWPPSLVLIVVFAAIAWAARDWKVGLVTLIGFVLVEGMDMWGPSMQTLSLIIMAAVVAVVFSIPVGILAARNNGVSAVVRPVLDFMQTLHPFVYLPIVVAFFGIGAAAGLAATIVFASPPAVRLTELGIRQVDKEMVEAGEAFGAAPRQILGKIQFPLAIPTIMAGVNQVIMLSLSMVVLAGLIGTPGLGVVIVGALGTLDVSQAFAGGIALVVIAIFLDRTSGAVSVRSGKGARANA